MNSSQLRVQRTVSCIRSRRVCARTMALLLSSDSEGAEGVYFRSRARRGLTARSADGPALGACVVVPAEKVARDALVARIRSVARPLW